MILHWIVGTCLFTTALCEEASRIPVTVEGSQSRVVNEMQGGIDDLLDFVYSGDRAKDRPKDCKVTMGGLLYVCNNGESPLFKISSFQMYPYPLLPGYTDIRLVAKLARAVEQGSKLELDSFRDGKQIFSGTLDLCEYITFAGFSCKLAPWTEFSDLQNTLDIPPEVPAGMYSFVATARGKRGEFYGRIAAIIDLTQFSTGSDATGPDLTGPNTEEPISTQIERDL
uniref:ARAD1B04378p n=1 Tax=Blastobotrys adeninivorans TaxID=409370 RepID=A0A060T5G9_BLAAD